MSKVVNTLQEVAVRENQLSHNPNLKFKFNQHTGDQYILRLGKKTHSKKESKEIDERYKGRHFLDEKIQKRKEMRS